MNILLLDDDEAIVQNLDTFLKIEEEWNYLTYDTFVKNSLEGFVSIDLIIADFINSEYETLLNELVSYNKSIKTIIVSDKLKSSVKEGCDFCQENYKRKRLIKPFEPNELYLLIKNFDTSNCSYYNAFENIQDILSIIVKRFPSLIYDEALKTVCIDTNRPTSRHTLEFVSLVNILEQNHIQYNIADNLSIKLL